MFHFPALPHAALCIQAAATAHDGRRVSPFGNPRITAWLPAPRGISQAPASFLGSWCQGIHRAPLKTWHTTTYIRRGTPPPRREEELQVLDARVHCAVLKKQTATPATTTKTSPPPPPPRRQPRARRENPGRERPLPQDPPACPPGPAPRSPVPGRHSRPVLDKRGKQDQVNSQCSTRQHGRPGGHTPPAAPDAP